MKKLILFLGLTLFSHAKAKPLLILDEPLLVQQLEDKGFKFSQVISGTLKNKNSDLIKHSNYQSFIKFIEQDLDDIKAGDKYLSVTMAKKHRLFDKRWLSSKLAFFELIGVFTRFDRIPFSNNPKFSCGEVRLIYRLAYRKTEQKEKIYTRLPLTLNLVYWAKNKNLTCPQVAKGWDVKSSKAITVIKNKDQFKFSNLKAIEINLQAVRWPSSIRPDFGGYAEYLMRVFKFDQIENKFKASFMENMIDVEKIKIDSKLKNELKTYLTNPLIAKNFDKGIGTIPDKFLTTKSISAAFHGMGRLKNRPFDQVFKNKDFQDLNFTDYRFVKTPSAYLRRLNDMSCVGCHQGRAIAGFHFIGNDKKEIFSANAIIMSRSGHLQLDLKRRTQYIAQLISGKTAVQARGFSERLETEVGKYGAHCSLGTDISFVKWNCKDGLKCQSIDTATTNSIIGVCLPEKNKFAGDPCDVGRISQKANSRRDRIIKKSTRACRKGQYCFKASDGFPGGLCYGECSDLKDGEGCGLIAFNGFNSCLGSNRPFTTCLNKYTGELSLKSCNTENPCRDDFVCARTKNNTGVCIPPYFLFQLRVDGHPKPL
ncbi:MAG: hypothetical protein ACI9QD_000045 [Thermoproteota archaeon]|jgi:hypothetical protein